MKRYVGMNHFPPPLGLDASHGWFTANGMTKYGPALKRETPAEATWPPRHMERVANATAAARAHLPRRTGEDGG